MFDFKYGLSEKPPTIKMKLTGDPVFLASSKSSETFASIFSNSGWKKLYIRDSGNSTPEAPLAVSCYSFGLSALYAATIFLSIGPLNSSLM